MEVYLQIKNALDDIFDNQGFINLVINKRIKEVEKQNQPLFSKVVYGVTENKIFLDYNIHRYLVKDLKNKDILQLLRIGFYILHFTNLTKALVVNEIVELSKEFDKSLSGLVNGVLKKTINDTLSLPDDSVDHLLSVKYSYPEKLVNFLRRMYEDQIEDILKHPTTIYNTYRINPLKDFSIDDIKVKYQLIDNSIVTEANLNNTKFVKQGILVNQNLSSQRVIKLVDKKPHMMVLDMCSAPGSKALMLAEEMNNQVDITCLDIYQHKIDLINKQSELQGVTCLKTLVQDASQFQTTKQFDLILLDAPCSGLGVMKHKVDLKYQFSFKKLEELYPLQKALLGKAYQLLKEEGVLIYSTCTINPLENEEIMKYFFKKHKDMKLIEEVKQLPNDLYDGFYICKMKKEKKNEEHL